ncbi:SDR family NAD(P)-dependent oxidoreductase [Anditalea andensis]|uniref:Short-chain dehydrogenase n=1 Tax=Anditalea andensis TaxID=1048983 RepID=A0A074KYN0_9BACT|nr:glucose 1-dehydrogenase [Anditalea andensis]KEO72713.1 short-chain dehydrogenase [Anditalea andensis]
MNNSLKNKVVIVTGGSKGIGAGIAKQMGLAGAKVVVNYASSQESADTVVSSIIEQGGNAMAIKADVSNQADVERLFEETIHAYRQVDTLVNNAGCYEFAPLESFTESSYRKIFDLNVLGILLASQEAVKHFSPKGGSIINITSFAGPRPEPYSVVYSASKGAADSITYALSQELGPKQIRVNSIRPGGVLTEGVAKWGATEDSEAVKAMIARSALARMATPDDIGQMAVFLASDASGVITGQTIEVSGGLK